ncbi:hypothetical protein TUM15748_01850 [Neisseria gonorrhoeae]|nr:hypothetical protein TUM15748C_06530 [Neisseria gonorrhoeae]GFL04530.1 hypothetical protein TUM15748_01850 [Neisseria gonorrhoeae]
MQEYAADAALGGVAEYKAAVQGFVLDAREDFAAHSVLDVQARFGGCLTDIVRQRDEFCRIDGVDNAQTGLFRIIACQRFGKILQLVFVLQQGFRFGQQYFARPRQYHAFPRAPEQRRADIFFKGFNLGGNGRLGKEKSFGGLGKVALVRDGDK